MIARLEIRYPAAAHNGTVSFGYDIQDVLVADSLLEQLKIPQWHIYAVVIEVDSLHCRKIRIIYQADVALAHTGFHRLKGLADLKRQSVDAVREIERAGQFVTKLEGQE